MKLISENLKKIILDIFYPNRCPCCNGFIRWDEIICDKCVSDIEQMENPDFCPLCGRNPCICDSGLFYDRAFVYKPYDGAIRNGVISMKRGNNTNFAEYAGEKLAAMLESCQDIDCIIPVPMSAAKKRSRGYNQAELISDKISEILGIPVRNDILFMIYSKKEQHSKSAKERAEIKNYLEINENADLSDMKIIICDDVITTSSTVNACAELLKSKGAAEVIAVLASGTVLKI